MRTRETCSRVQSLHGASGTGYIRSAQRHQGTLSRVQKTSGREPQSARAETKGQTTSRRPRGKRPTALVDRRFFSHLAGEFFPGETLADNVPYQGVKPIRVGEGRVLILAKVVAEGLLIDIPKQMVWLDGYVGPVDSSLKQDPKILAIIRVCLLVHVSNRVVDHLMGVLFAEPIVGLQGIAVERGLRLDVLRTTPPPELDPAAQSAFRAKAEALALKYRTEFVK